MSQQDIIREGMADILEVWMDRDLALVTARAIMAKEHYQGVVIKKERKLPHCPYNALGWTEYEESIYKGAQKDMCDDGWVATVPLLDT